jgi:hypothetical protein
MHDQRRRVPTDGTELTQRRTTPGSDDVNVSAHAKVSNVGHAEIAS